MQSENGTPDTQPTEDPHNQPRCWCKHSRHDAEGHCHYPYCHETTPASPDIQPDDLSEIDDPTITMPEPAGYEVKANVVYTQPGDELEQRLKAIVTRVTIGEDLAPGRASDDPKPAKTVWGYELDDLKALIARERQAAHEAAYTQGRRDAILACRNFMEPNEARGIPYVETFDKYTQAQIAALQEKPKD